MTFRPASSHRLTFILVGLILLGFGTMTLIMKEPSAFRAAVPPVQTTHSAVIVISSADFVTVPAGSTVSIYVAGVDRDRMQTPGSVLTEDVITDSALPNGASLNRCNYTAYFGATPIQVGMFCLTYSPTNAEIGNHPIVLRAKEYGTGLPSDSPLTLTFVVTGNPASSSSSSEESNPNLLVTAVASPTAALGGNIRTVYSISNNGTANAVNVRLRTAVPTAAGITFNPVGSDPSCAISGTDIVCGPIPFIPPGPGSSSLTINYALSFGTTCPSTFLRNATVTAENPVLALAPGLSTSISCSPTNPYCCYSGVCAENPGCQMTQNQCLTSCGVNSSSSSASAPDLGISILLGSNATLNQPKLYQLYAVNTGTMAGTNVNVSIPLPDGFAFVPASSNPACTRNNADPIICAFPPLAPASAALYDITFTPISSSLCNTSVPVQATITSNETDSNTTNNIATVNTTISCASSSSSIGTSAVCGDGIVNGTEECDDGMQCAPFGTSCTSNADCQSGQTCQTWDGDGCFANCSLMFPPDSIFP